MGDALDPAVIAAIINVIVGPLLSFLIFFVDRRMKRSQEEIMRTLNTISFSINTQKTKIVNKINIQDLIQKGAIIESEDSRKEVTRKRKEGK